MMVIHVSCSNSAVAGQTVALCDWNCNRPTFDDDC